MNDQSEPQLKRMKKQEELGFEIDHLPDLAFEKVLSYLSLENLIKFRRVSKRWCQTIDGFKMKTLSLSTVPQGFAIEKTRMAQNFISSLCYKKFFRTFGHSILSHLKRLHLYEPHLDPEKIPEIIQTLESFGQTTLEELGFFDFTPRILSNSSAKFELNLPMLKSIQLDCVYGIGELTLNAPRLESIKIRRCPCSFRLELIHVESIEKLVTDNAVNHLKVENLKNLKYLYISNYDSPKMNPVMLASLKRLEEFHSNDFCSVLDAFKQKQRHSLAELKIFYYGLLLNDPSDPAIQDLVSYPELCLGYLASRHLARLAEEVPLLRRIFYSDCNRLIEPNFLNRFTDLEQLVVPTPIKNIDGFLNLLKKLDHNVWLQFRCATSQTLLDGLSESYPLRRLTLWKPPPNLDFLFKLKSLVYLHLEYCVNVEFIQQIFKLPFLLVFIFKYSGSKKTISIQTDYHRKRYRLKVNYVEWSEFSELNEAIKFLVETKNI